MSTTVKAETSLSSWNYVYYCVDKFGDYHVFLSDYDVVLITQQSGLFNTAFDLTNGSAFTLTNSAEYYVTSATSSYNNTSIANKKALHLKYNGLEWESYQPYLATCNSATTIGTQRGSIHAWIFCRDYTLGKDTVNYISSISTNKPSGFPEIDFSKISIEDLEEKIDNALNSTTSATTEANSINQQVTNNYILYSNGDISLSTLQANIDSLVQQLEDLNNRSGTTLADKVAINNAITQTQIVQDAANKDAIIQEMEEDLTVSSSTSSIITGKINEANTVFNNYSQGTTTQTEAVTQINQYITQLTQLITPQTPTADINAINAAINTINGIKDSVTSHSDLDDSVSESAQNSDKEEIEYLENIEAETTENIDSLKTKVDDSISQNQANQVKNNVIAPILQNTLIVKVLPIAALFMVLAVTLGFKYRL